MALLATFADRLAFADRNLLSGRTASMMVAVAVAAGAAALISCFDPLALLSNPAFLKTAESAPFEARFFPSSISSSVSLPARPTGSVSSQFELRFAPANALLDQSQQAHEQAAATVEQSATLPVASVPVPRPRPVELAPNAVATEV